MYLTATLGIFDVAAMVDNVSVTGKGEKHMILSSPLLASLNRQLQFVSYRNTVFHPKTADTGKVVMLDAILNLNVCKEKGVKVG